MNWDEQALKYLRAKFPEVPEQAFFTDYRGKIHKHVINVQDVIRAEFCENLCTHCKGECLMKSGKPVASIRTSNTGFDYLSVGWVSELSCKFRPISPRMQRLSGLTDSQMGKTFDSYEINDPESKNAKVHAMKSAMKHTGLILAGKRGTGKTHLAIAIALNAMEQGRQAIFRLVNDLLEELRQSVRDDEFIDVMRRFKQVDVLILDDLGKERSTDAGFDYLYQIIDYRYRNNLQTVITTNAMSIQELEKWGKPEYLTPMCSRVLEAGSWVTLRKAQDRRLEA